MFNSICSMCFRFNVCSDVKKFINTHSLKVSRIIDVELIGLKELYGESIVTKALKLLDRFRKIKGFRYVFRSGGVSLYLRRNDINRKVDGFLLDKETGFYEFTHGA